MNVVSLVIPPLRERKEDIVPLVDHFPAVVNQKYHTQKSVFYDTIDAFENYAWPGNVRELANVLESLVITSPGDVIKREHLPAKFSGGFQPSQNDVSPDGEMPIVPLKQEVERAEYAAINRAIQQLGSVRKAAAALGWPHLRLFVR